MAKYTIGVTEAGDAGLDTSWKDRISDVDGAILMTKQITPEFVTAAIANKDKIIVHATVTGYGGTVLEPNVPSVNSAVRSLNSLLNSGFPSQNVVIRVDPIIPTPKGIRTAEEVIKRFMKRMFCRFRISILDMYPHVSERFRNARLPSPYGGSGFAPSAEQITAVDDMILRVQQFYSFLWGDEPLWPLRIEACAEPELTRAIQCGCVSQEDIKRLKLEDDDFESKQSADHQRKNCLCHPGKIELLSNRHPCSLGCLYCYMKD